MCLREFSPEEHDESALDLAEELADHDSDEAELDDITADAAPAQEQSREWEWRGADKVEPEVTPQFTRLPFKPPPEPVQLLLDHIEPKPPLFTEF